MKQEIRIHLMDEKNWKNWEKKVDKEMKCDFTKVKIKWVDEIGIIISK